MKKLISLILVALMVLSLSACGGSGKSSEGTDKAADFPKRAITVNTSKSGSLVDTAARCFATYYADALGVNVIVNSTGGQVEGARDLKNADADGYTIGWFNNTVQINDVTGSTDFNSIDDFKFVGVASVSDSNWLAVKSDFAKANNINTYEDLVKYTEAHPDELKISDRRNSNTAAVVKKLQDAGLKAVSVDAGTGADRLTAFLGGSFEIYIANSWSGFLEQYIQSGEMVCLMSCGSERSLFSPDIPCSKELGVDAAFPTIYFVAAPKDTPDDVVAILSEGMKKVCENEEFVKKFTESISAEVKYLSAADATAELSKQKQELIDLGWGTGYQGK